MTLASTTKRRRARQRAKYRKLHPPKAGQRFVTESWMFKEAIRNLENQVTVAKTFNRDYR